MGNTGVSLGCIFRDLAVFCPDSKTLRPGLSRMLTCLSHRSRNSAWSSILASIAVSTNGHFFTGPRPARRRELPDWNGTDDS
jgi:hypothetical protein